MGPYVFVNSLAVGFFAFAALHYFWHWWLSRREGVFLVFAAHCGVCTLLCPVILSVATAPTIAACQAALDARTTLVLVLQPLTAGVYVLVTGVRARTFGAGISVVCGLLAAINLLILPLNGAVTALESLQLPWGEVVVYPRRGPAGWWVGPMYAVFVSVQLFGLWAATKLRARDRVGAILVASAALCSLTVITTAVLIDRFHIPIPYLGMFPNAIFVVLISLLLSRAYARRGEQVAASEHRFRTLVEHASDGIFICDPQGRYLDVNPAGCQMLGYRPEQILRLSLGDVIAPEETPRLEPEVARLLGGAAVKSEWHFRRQDGSLFCGEVNGRQLPDGRLLGFVRDISDRKRTEEQLRTSEALYRTVIESAPEAIVVLDVDRGAFVDFNRNACALFGVSARDILALGPADLSPPFQPDGRESGAAVFELLRAAIAGHNPIFEWQHRSRDGRDIPCEVRLARLPDPHRVLIRGSVTDISERKRAEAALRRSEELFRSAFDYATIGKALVAPDGKWLRVNRSFCELVGYTEAELLATDFQAITHPEDLATSLASLRQMLAGTVRTYQLEKRYIHKLGHVLHILLSVALVRDTEGAPLYSIVQIQDISERKRAEEALRRSEERYRLIVKHQTEFIVKWLPDGTRTFVNESYCRHFGVREDDCVGSSFFPLIAPEFRELILRKIASITPATPEATDEHLSFVAGGEQRWQQWTDVGVFDAAGRLVELLSTGRDITERKHAEEKLHSYHERLKALSQQVLHTQETERRRLARELHHEIGQILTAIGLHLHQLKARCGPDLHAMLDDDMAVVNRAIEQVREMSLNLRPPMLDVLGLEAALRWYAENQRHRTGLDVLLVGHLDTEHFDPDLEIACFRVVQEALTNVLRHARATRAWIELQQEEDELHVVVRDDGVGFDVSAAQARAGRGRSFGVLSMQERVELLNGHLAIDSAPGRGTRITARFPIPLPAAECVEARP